MQTFQWLVLRSKTVLKHSDILDYCRLDTIPLPTTFCLFLALNSMAVSMRTTIQSNPKMEVMSLHEPDCINWSECKTTFGETVKATSNTCKRGAQYRHIQWCDVPSRLE